MVFCPPISVRMPLWRYDSWSGWFGNDFTLNGVLLRFSGAGSLGYSMVVRGSCEDVSARLGFHCDSVARGWFRFGWRCVAIRWNVVLGVDLSRVVAFHCDSAGLLPLSTA